MKRIGKLLPRLIFLIACGAFLPVARPAGSDSPPAALELTDWTVTLSSRLTAREKVAATMLLDEVEHRTGIRWPMAGKAAATSHGTIWIGRKQDDPLLADSVATGTAEFPAEGYSIRTVANREGATIYILGNDERGVLFGAGRLLRAMEMDAGKVTLPGPVNLASAPHYALRGHQISYRPKSNTYDAWTVPMREQFIRDVAVFGTNAVELIPPDSDDLPYSPHFTLPAMEMMSETSRLLDKYGLDVWLWYPMTRADYSDPATVDEALKEWGEVFANLPRLDGLFVPSANGHPIPPDEFFPFLEKLSPVLKRYHPDAELWISPQAYKAEWMDAFFERLRAQPAYLTGVVYGPSVRIGLPEFRKLVPPRYGVRFYPDIAHNATGQYPVADLDPALGVTHGRESINPRPLDQTHIFRLFQSFAERGFITYSEGCNDDVNKFVWSSLGWDPESEPAEILREYSRYFIGGNGVDAFAEGLLALERNWHGPLIANDGVDATLAHFQALEAAATPRELNNWRLQLALYRAYFDAYVRARLIRESEVESAALAELQRVDEAGSRAAMTAAQCVLDQLTARPTGPELHARLVELADALFHNIGLQLSVSRHNASDTRRGATLDTVDMPLSNAPWLLHQMEKLRTEGDEAQRRAAIHDILDWTNPGPGGFYDNLGDASAQPHLVPGPGVATDPGFLHSANVDFNYTRHDPPWRYAWHSSAETFYDTPLVAHYKGLDPSARYHVRVVYAGEDNYPIRLTADDDVEIHPFRHRDTPVRPVEFAVPKAATEDGELTLKWHLPAGVTKGAQCTVAEVWLMKD